METLKRLRARSIRKVAPISIIAMVIGVVIFIYFGCIGLFGVIAPKSLSELDPEKAVGAYVEADITELYAAYAREREFKDNQPVKVTGMQYITDFNEYYFMGLFVHRADLDAAERLYENGSPAMHVKGSITAMDDEILEYYLDCADGDKALEEIMLPYYLDIGCINGRTVAGVIVAAVVALAFFAFGLGFLLKAVTGGYQKKIKAKLESMGEGAMEKLDRFYDETEPVSGVRVGREFILCESGAGSYLFVPGELVWAYQQTTKHRTNGIPTGKTFATILRTMDGARIELSMKELQVKALLDHFNEAAPGIVLGYTDELADLYKKNRAAFADHWREAQADYTDYTEQV